MFPLPRVVYAMADDGLIFKSLASINKKTQTPVIATISMASLAAVLAAIFDLKELVDFMSIGTLMAYTLVAASVMILRYRKKLENFQAQIERRDSTEILSNLATEFRYFVYYNAIL